MTEEGENSEIIVSVKQRFMSRNPPSGPSKYRKHVKIEVELKNWNLVR